MQNLTSILTNSSLRQQWKETEAAGEFEPLPAGEYVARIVGAELSTSNSNGTPSYKLTFGVAEGPYKGRHFWHDVWLTKAALPMAKRDLGKLGVTDLDQLEHPMPAGIRCRVKVVLRRDDNGTNYNRVRTFTVEGVDTPEPDAFAPPAAKTSDEGGVDGV